VDDLPAGRLAAAEDGGDLRVADVEHLVEQERGALVRREPLEQREERNRQIGCRLEGAIG
jgi:hypothetical protein